ncbi:hypothetical protein MML48_1g03082 [Holotrichia oblita]|uniref:Uncharacterized protein n=1 Tax=Holotrichia oblita TaxID=644536 RepID=A0ACB9TYQ3_HOLOL|nr:hypothetical protein MML48_1g03082 [Holotrichia oblita]
MNPSRIYNLDETSTTTVQNPKEIIAEKGIKQVSSSTSGEREILVTTGAIICAVGTFFPPAIIFPRKFFKQHMLHGSPHGTLGLANPSAWLTSELFPKVMDHFISLSHSTKENPSLLIYDNLDAHLSIEVVDKARAALQPQAAALWAIQGGLQRCN